MKYIASAGPDQNHVVQGLDKIIDLCVSDLFQMAYFSCAKLK